jgi:hypothetical protein
MMSDEWFGFALCACSSSWSKKIQNSISGSQKLAHCKPIPSGGCGKRMKSIFELAQPMTFL